MQNCYSKNSEQTERLTTKHIHTLKFMQEIVSENKDLKQRVNELEDRECRCAEFEAFAAESQERIKRIQEEYLTRADEVNKLLTEKHKEEMMKKVEDNLLAEKNWAEEKAKLLAEIEQLKKENEALRRQIAEQSDKKEQTKIFELKVAALEQEIVRLKELQIESDEKARASIAQASKIGFLEDQNKHLKTELDGANQRIQELEYTIRKLEKDLSDSGQNEQTDLLLTLKNKLAKMHKERSVYEEREKEYLERIAAVTEENEKLRRALDSSERMRQDMKINLDELVQELAMLKRQLSMDKDKQTFKDFILVKRELAVLKEEHEALKIKLKFTRGGGKDAIHLPSLKKTDGGVRPSSGRRKDSLTQRRDIQQNALVAYK